MRGRSISNGRTYLQRMYPTPTGFRWLYALAMSESGDQRRRRRGPVARITNAAAEAVDVNAMVESVDVDGVVQRIDVDAVIQRVDVNALLDEVDVNALLDRVDVNALLDRVDVDRLLDRADPDRLMERVDMNALMDRVDVRAVVARAGVAEIVQESTGQVAGSVVDAARRQIAAVDKIAGGVALRAVGKDPRTLPAGPASLMAGFTPDEKGRGMVSGHYAGPVSRFLAFLVDFAVVFGSYTLMASALTFFLSEVLGLTISMNTASIVGLVALVVWGFLYLFVGLLIAGGSVGKGLVGIKVVGADGSPIRGGQAFVRVLTYPLSFLIFGLGLIGIPFGARRLAWHDRFAKTCVVIDWGDRPAALPAPLTAWIAQHNAAEQG